MCLHSGTSGAVSLERVSGPLAFARGEATVARSALAVVRTDRGVAIQLGQGGPVVDLVEHLFATLSAHGVGAGVRIVFESSEVPLLDGGAREFCRALSGLAAQPCPPALRIARAATLEHRGSVYRFEPGEGVRLSVVTEFPPPLGVQKATWTGDLSTFVEQLAPARTFGFSSERADLARRGRARYVDPEAVMVFDPLGRVMAPGQPMGEREIARHKLLDLIGDLYVYGGPPIGRLHADRPGHPVTHAVVSRAFREGILVAARAPSK